VSEANSESEIIRGIIAHQEDAFRQLVAQYQDYVYRICMSFVKQSEEAEDLSQEVFIEIYDSASHFRQESKLSTWIYKIAVNKSLNFIKKRKRSEWVNILDPLYSSKEKKKIQAQKSDEADHTLNIFERNKYLYESIDSLPKNQRIAFTLNKIDGIPYQEISEIMEVSIPSVESLIHRAKINLQKKLYPYFKK
jgi:RNA polymerase sigma-70 factor, ECF subfamily